MFGEHKPELTPFRRGTLLVKSAIVRDRQLAIFHVKFGEAFASALEAIDDDLGNALHQFVAEFGVVFASDQYPRSIEHDGLCVFERARLEVPGKRWKEPGPAEYVACADSLQRYVIAPRNVRFDAHAAFQKEEELVSSFVLAKEHLPRGKFDFARMPCQHVEVLGFHSSKKWMLSQGRFQIFHVIPFSFVHGDNVTWPLKISSPSVGEDAPFLALLSKVQIATAVAKESW